MSDYIEYKDSVAFHPGYYIKEIIEDEGLTQEDFAKRLGTTPKNLSLLVRGEQSLSVDMAMKLSRMLGTSIAYWQNLQSAYDALEAQIAADQELEQEKQVLKELKYDYFRDNFGLPDLPRKVNEQVAEVRKFLRVSSLCVLCQRDMAVSFRSVCGDMDEAHIARANAMVQIAANRASDIDAPKFNKVKFEKAAEYALTQTANHGGFYPLIEEAFLEAGVILVLLPNLPGSKMNGATKKIGSSVMLIVNDRRLNADSFWFTLFHEIGHIVNGDFGISFESETGEREALADKYAQDALIDPAAYESFVRMCGPWFDARVVTSFAKSIDRDPGIVLGRLQNDGYVRHNNQSMQNLRCKYKVVIE